MAKKKPDNEALIKELTQYVADQVWAIKTQLVIMQSLVAVMFEAIQNTVSDDVRAAIIARVQQNVEQNIANDPEDAKNVTRMVLAEALRDFRASPPTVN